MKKIVLSSLAATLLLFGSCQKTGFLTRYGIFHVENDTTATMNGTITKRTEKHFDNMLDKNPNISLIVLEDCPGSKDDDTNLKVAKKVFDKGISTELKSHSEIASGAVDFFLAGRTRTIATGARLGVHSWNGGGKVPTLLPVDSPSHDPYIDFYKSVGFSDSLARDFYFFTIHAAPHNSIHWMTEEEIDLYQMRK